MDFFGKRALVTGAGKGIGRAVTIALCQARAETIAISRSREDLEELTKQFPDLHAICLDISDWIETEKVIKELGTIDLLVNNAGVSKLQKAIDATSEDYDRIFNTNVKAVINITKEISKSMIEAKVAGSIVNVSSQASKRALHEHLLYCASKGALDQITRCFALELGSHNIRVNSVNPTVVLTEMGKLAWSNPSKSCPMLDHIPLGRFAEEQDVVNGILYLLSDLSSMTTGATLPIDGGYWIA